MAEHTKGPWIWQSFDGGKTLFLGTPNRGRLMVMDFVRQGLQQATARFAKREGDNGGVMHRVTLETVENFPDARLMKAAPDLLEACRLIDFAWTGLTQERPSNPVHATIWEQQKAAVDAVRAAIAKATTPSARDAGKETP